MKTWFENFFTAPGKDLIGAGTATSERAMNHYRFQHQAKMKEAVEATFPKLLQHVGQEWENIWKSFWEQNTISPRNLDWFPEVFLNYFVTTSNPSWMKELARFEHRLDIHPWQHCSLALKTDFVLSEDAKVILGKFELVSFSAPVSEIYDEETTSFDQAEIVLIWEKESGTHFRKMEDWEIEILMKLPEGVSVALESAPDDELKVGEFFQWLGSSALIQHVN
ncbi:MAG: hypothetical protein V4598_04645 [Bdellovibrionota bacterium]